MCDCSDSSDYSSDEKRELVGDCESKLIPLNFTNDEKYGFHEKLLDTGVHLTDFDQNKLSIKRNEFNNDNFDILYDGKPLRIYLRAFTATIKRSKYFKREKNIKVKDPMVSRLLWNVFHNVEELVRLEMQKHDRYCWFLEPYKVWIDCDERLAPKHLYYFEEAAIAFDLVIQTDDDFKWSKEYRLDVSMIDCHVMLPAKN